MEQFSNDGRPRRRASMLLFDMLCLTHKIQDRLRASLARTTIRVRGFFQLRGPHCPEKSLFLCRTSLVMSPSSVSTKDQYWKAACGKRA